MEANGEGVSEKGEGEKESPVFYRISQHVEHDKIKIHMAEYEETFQFSFQKTLKEKRWKIFLKPEQEAESFIKYP